MAKLTYEGALAQQKEAKAAVKEAKGNLTDYYKENKLKRNQDYSADKKHGKKISNLEKEVKKASATLENLNEKVESLKDGAPKKPKGGVGRTKYDYPEDVKTPDQKKKYRQAMRAKAAGKTPKAEKPTKEEKVGKAKKAKKEETSAGTKPSGKSTKETKVAKRSADKKESSKKKVKKSKKNEDD